MLPLEKDHALQPLPSLQKLKFGKNSGYRRLTFFPGGGRVAVVRHVWLLQICSKNFCPLCTFKPHAMPGRNYRDVISDFIINVPHDKLVYPPKIYLPALIIVTVGPLPSHREWNVLEAQPSTNARQQRFQTEVLLCSTATIHLQNH